MCVLDATVLEETNVKITLPQHAITPRWRPLLLLLLLLSSIDVVGVSIIGTAIHISTRAILVRGWKRDFAFVPTAERTSGGPLNVQLIRGEQM